jgi:heme-degrading monooxygenase HmoA
MIKRIVKLTFKLEKVDVFFGVFNAVKSKIRNFEGCSHLEVWNDVSNSNVYYTYSYWESEEALNNYRNSKLFNDVWSKTKVLFSDPAEAWSVSQLEIVD